MAKRRVRVNVKSVSFPDDTDKFVEWTCSKGYTVILKALPPLLMTRISRAIKVPVKPQYSITTAAGDEEVFDHDETTLSSDDDKKIWGRYIADMEAAETAMTEKILSAILLEGVEPKVSPEDVERWKRKQVLIGLDIPEYEDELMMHFKESEIAVSKEDITYILKTCMALTGVSPEEIDETRRSFRNSLESKS